MNERLRFALLLHERQGSLVGARLRGREDVPDARKRGTRC